MPSRFRPSLSGWLCLLAAGWSTYGNAATVAPSWHCDSPVLSPDGVRVAFQQWDSPFVRIVVVNLDQPGRTMYVNLGTDWTESVTILWMSSQKVELRKGQEANTFAVFTVDAQPVLPAEAPIPSDHPSQPLLDRPAIDGLLKQKLPHRSLQIANWDEAGRRVLLLASGSGDPGRFFVYDRSTDVLFEIARRKMPSPTP